MSRKLTALLVGLFGSLAVAAGVMQGCGGGSASGDAVSLCQQGCDKILACAPDAGPDAQQRAVQCKQGCTQLGNGHCSNEAEIASATRSCLQLACDAYMECSVPLCQSTTGTGGTTGGGGNGGTSGGGGAGGSSGGGWTCVETTDGCACSPGAGGGQSSCTGTYTCCVRFTSNGTDACTCSNVTASQCTASAGALNGTTVASCP
ncbi:MAG TPA: hypothetical protein VN903_38350 [Polyangia bacterium]|jgi:hypothetical protein|nr:hypothetical protein [Polyangia bacterium]